MFVISRLAASQTTTCNRHAAHPFTGDLGEPIGDRELVDISIMQARPVTVDEST
jgi:hypothetical protein